MGERMVTLYHGTHHLYAATLREFGIRVDVSNRALDFGPGFYMTTSRDQAALWAKRLSERRFIPVPPAVLQLLKQCKVTESEFTNARKLPRLIAVSFDWAELVKLFPGRIYTADAEWQELVHRCRHDPSYHHPYLWVRGPVADGGLTGPAKGIVAYNEYDQVSIHEQAVAWFIQREGIRIEEP